MRYIFIMFAMFFVVACGSRPQPDIPMTWMPDPTLSIDNRVVTSDSVVFLGDSLSHIPVWQDDFPDVHTANQGIGGNTTFQVLLRLDEIVNKKPAKIFLLIGANDLNAGIPHALITENQRKIIEKIRMGSPDTKLYVQSIFPFGKDVRVYFPNNVPKSFVKDIQELNKSLVWICAINKVTYLDVHGSVMRNAEGYLKADYTIDQVHLSEQGQEAWVEYLERYVR
jgi:lysophospholipase L1-like esterase